MRIVPVPARSIFVPADSAQASPAAIVCAALLLALIFLIFQIAHILGSQSFPDCSSIVDSLDGGCPIPETRADHPLT
jgi:hypothetical protein